jgi:ATP-binding cassette, subfamily B, bacterial
MQQSLPRRVTSFIRHFLKPYSKNFAIIMLLMIMAGLIPSLDGYLMKIVIDKVSEYNDIAGGVSFFATMAFSITIYVLWWFIPEIIWRTHDYFALKTYPNISGNIIGEMFEYVERHSHKYFIDNFAGSIANKIGDMENSAIKMLELCTQNLMRKFFIIIFAVITMATVHLYLGATLLLWVTSFVLINFIYAGKIDKLSNDYSEYRTSCLGKVVDSINNITQVRLFARNSFERDYLRQHTKEMVSKYQTMDYTMLKMRIFTGISCVIMIALMLVILAILRQHNLVTLGDFALILTLSVSVLFEVWMLTQEIGDVSVYFGKCNQALSVISVPHEITDIEGAKELIVTDGKITFEDIKFTFKDGHTLFNNKNITINGGQKVGLVGFSGSGKTTFVNLIVRMFEPDSGTIKIDNQDVQNVTQDSLRENIGFIPQDPVLFHRSIMENIRYGNIDATDEEVIDAAIRSKVHDFIQAMPHGYDSAVGERGTKLSGGQRQRVAIARAVLKNAPILILDEATSALDSVTENYIQENLGTIMKGKTSIVIAHRLTTLLNMDRILIFDNGVIVEDGTHKELLAKKDGMYSLLWNSQVGGFLPESMDEILTQSEDI